MRIVIGISGKKGSGKNTLASQIVQHCGGDYTVIHFADRLKSICIEISGFSKELFYDDILKETELLAPVDLDTWVDRLSDLTDLHILPRGLTAKTPREILQFVGTDYVRSVDRNFWERKLVERVSTFPENTRIVVADVRFPSEADVIRSLNGVLVGVSRPAKNTTSVDKHKSETGVGDITTDLRFEFSEVDTENAYIDDSYQHIAAALKVGSYVNAWHEISNIVQVFNTSLDGMTRTLKYGANFEWRYNSSGRKCLRVKDIAPINALSKDNAALAASEVEKIMEGLCGPRTDES